MHDVDDPNLNECLIVNEIGTYLAGLTSLLFFVFPLMLITVMYVLIEVRLKKSEKEIKSSNELANRSKQRATKMLSKNYFYY